MLPSLRERLLESPNLLGPASASGPARCRFVADSGGWPRSPDYILRVLVADVAAYERFQTTKLLVLPGVRRTISHQTMKLNKREL